ncbi:MAG: hypothetical protein FOGNACKC_02667 [Anaerolineae bacterium]|nr:hypothetical protein [Anaerolineae bacterium]
MVDGDKESDDPISGVTIRVVGDEDGFRGPYYATTGSDGKYSMVIGEYGKVPDRVQFRADIFGDGVDTDDEPEWKFSKDCSSSDPLQVMEIIWYKRGK